MILADSYNMQRGVYKMKNKNLALNQKGLANKLRKELLENIQVKKSQSEIKELSNMELISTSEKPYVSPIFSMSEDEILAFVEEFDVNELKTLSVEELNHIGKVLGVDPKILIEGED